MKSKKNNLEVFLSSRTGKRFFNIFYSWGAAIVIIGAMCKLVHFPIGDMMLVIGMVVEALVFILAGLDNSDIDDDKYIPENQGIVPGGVIGVSTNSSTISKDNASSSVNTTKDVRSTSDRASGPIVIVNGGSAGSSPVGGGGSSVNTNSNAGISTNNTNIGNGNNPVVGTNTSYPNNNQDIANSPNTSTDYHQASQNIGDFSKTMQSLNEASQEILNAYKQMGDNQNLANNLTELNKNIAGLNELFGSLSEQMTSVRYINDSLSRMKNLYDGAIGDGYMFKEESAKMTKHIEALNNVYARLLQAMTSNNNLNQNPPY